MAYMDWNDSLMVGNDMIDWDHRTLVEMVNEFHDAPENDRAAGETLMQMLETYTVEHFAREEQLMEQTLYPAYTTHKKEHHLLLKLFVQNRDGWRSGKVQRVEILNFVKMWLSGHIKGTDIKLASHLKGKEIRETQLVAAPCEPERRKAVVNWPRLSVMVVEDVPNMRHQLKAILRSFGITDITEAPNGIEALKHMKNLPKNYDVILCDDEFRPPFDSPINGIEFIRILRTERDSPAPKAVVILTAENGSVGTVQAALAAGVHDVLAKPYSANSIRLKMERYLSNPLPMEKVNGVLTPIRPKMSAQAR
ncbi:MAG: bacteriohemerythrin [Rhodospirillales bacterium]|nr:bacteriohemerythrin [Rhodospirillales bacterium]